MRDLRRFFIDGQWVEPLQQNDFEVLNPATEQPIAIISLGSAADVDRAARAARTAFDTFAYTSKAERLALLELDPLLLVPHYP